MKASIRYQYCNPDALQVQSVEKPEPKRNEILIRVRATTVSRSDLGILTGRPWAIRLFSGLLKPKLPIPGTDFAGEVEALGDGVSAFKPGDRVWGFNDNGLATQAQYLCLSEKEAILKIPEHISFEQAVASAEGAHYAINFINKVPINQTSKVLVYGATGAIGSAAVQILKSRGVYVVAVCAGPHTGLVAALGPDKVIDYTRQDFTQLEEKFDFVFDAVGKSRFVWCKPLLNPRGVYISSELGPRAENLLLPLLTKIKGGKRVKFPLPFDIKKSMSIMQELLEQGKFKPLLDTKTYPLEQISAAYAYVASGQKIGNVIISYD